VPDALGVRLSRRGDGRRDADRPARGAGTLRLARGPRDPPGDRRPRVHRARPRRRRQAPDRAGHRARVRTGLAADVSLPAPVQVFGADEQAEVSVDVLRFVRLAQLVLTEERAPTDAELSVIFVDEQAISDLNER